MFTPTDEWIDAHTQGNSTRYSSPPTPVQFRGRLPRNLSLSPRINVLQVVCSRGDLWLLSSLLGKQGLDNYSMSRICSLIGRGETPGSVYILLVSVGCFYNF